MGAGGRRLKGTEGDRGGPRGTAGDRAGSREDTGGPRGTDRGDKGRQNDRQASSLDSYKTMQVLAGQATARLPASLC